MRFYLDEAALLAAETAHTGCPVSDTASFMDRHPEVRLVLEDTWSDPFGRVYRDIPAERHSRWPAHIARTFRTFLQIGRNPAQVFQLLDVLHEIEADTAVVRMVMRGCRRRESLAPAIEYLSGLAAELRQVTAPAPDEEISLGVAEPHCRPRVRGADISAGSWYMTSGDEDEADRGSGSYRADLLHDPNSSEDEDADWLTAQPRAWQRLYWALGRANSTALANIREHLLMDGKARWNHDQLAVLWTRYHARRDEVRREDQRRAARNLSVMAQKLLRRVRRVRTEKEAGWVGFNLHRALRGDIQLPGVVSEAEWAVIFAAHRARKTELSLGTAVSAEHVRP